MVEIQKDSGNFCPGRGYWKFTPRCSNLENSGCLTSHQTGSLKLNWLEQEIITCGISLQHNLDKNMH